MLATDEILAAAVPVCLPPWQENPYRLVSLLFLITEFHLGFYFGESLQLQFKMDEFGARDEELNAEEASSVADSLGLIEQFCKEDEFNKSLTAVHLARTWFSGDWEHPSASARIHLLHALEALRSEMLTKKVLRVDENRAIYFNQKKLFGKDVYNAFPSARTDIIEAGNCITVGCDTAAVFHLMVSAEYGLRALARDRRIKVPKGPLELATWDDIIKQLEITEQAIQGYPKTLAREAQFEFYHGAMMEFKRFKNKFRNRIMHARDHYDQGEAHSAFTHVRDFMQILAAKISERKRTPVIWKRT